MGQYGFYKHARTVFYSNYRDYLNIDEYTFYTLSNDLSGLSIDNVDNCVMNHTARFFD